MNINQNEGLHEPEYFKTIAQHYHNLGFNVTCVGKRFQGVPDGWFVFDEKLCDVPQHSWQHLPFARQDIRELNLYDWELATGIGAVIGHDSTIVLRIHHCLDISILHSLIQGLGLPVTYEWQVLCGKGNHFEIYLRTEGQVPERFTGQDKIFLNSVKPFIFEAIEVCLKHHTLLPPSFHESGGKYLSSTFRIPENRPATVAWEKILNALEVITEVSEKIAEPV